jgi:membrane-bound PQQ-dependent dehydrogenase (glucose/quinate/shikimate family)
MIARTGVHAIALAMALAGLWLSWGGAQLIAAGGSWYYLPAGLALIASAAALVRGKRYFYLIYGMLLIATLAWALWEVGLDGWALVPRLVAPAVLGLVLTLSFVRNFGGQRDRWRTGYPALAIAGVLAFAGFNDEKPDKNLKPASVLPENAPVDGEWKVWARTLDGNRFSPLAAITTTNVGKLDLAWEFKSDVPPIGYHSFQATPLAAWGRLYTCLDRNTIVALDPDSGKPLWRFDPRPDLKDVFAATCRGVALFEATGATECPRRVLFGVSDGRMMALDADTGKLCRSFGTGGQVDLKLGLGQIEKGIAFPTSPPTIVGGVAMISGWVTDGLHTDEPSGGVRAYDAITGRLRWVWDTGRPEPAKPLTPGETYTKGAPNAWGVFSGDEALGLVYFGTGVTTPDYFGKQRTPSQEKYATSIVALDVATGKPRWNFQTVHHDIWDYDVGSQPVLTDLAFKGGKVPALIGPTKRGQFFVLDRRSGTPIFPVTEKPVPQGGAVGDWTAKTQPYSDSFANLAGPRLTEKAMWGATPFDQLACRIQFRKARYEGEFTPPGARQTLFYPGSAGGSNWGSATIDGARGLLIANSLYMADIGHLIPREEADRLAGAYGKTGHSSAFAFPQKGTPYAMDRKVFIGPFGAPCQQPPFGRISAIDLTTGKMVWSQPLGDARHAGVLGLSSHLPFRMGLPNLGGSMTTAGGLVFIGAAQDRMLRAFDIGNGKQLWSIELPAIAAATPMTFRSARTGRQYVVIAAGGHPALPGPPGSSILAFALPE